MIIMTNYVIKALFYVCAAMLLFSSCATIMAPGQREIRLRSVEDSVKVTLVGDTGMVVYTPADIILKPGRKIELKLERITLHFATE